MKNDKSQNLILITSILFIAAIIIVALFIAPKFYEIAKINLKIKDKHEQYDLGMKKIEAIKEAGNVMKISLGEINAINVSMPLQKNADEALITIEKVARDNLLDLKDVQIGKIDDSKSLAPIDVTLQGSYLSIAGFLKSFRNSLRPVDVDSYLIEGSGDKLTFSVNLLFPYFDEKINKIDPKSSGGQNE